MDLGLPVSGCVHQHLEPKRESLEVEEGGATTAMRPYMAVSNDLGILFVRVLLPLIVGNSHII